MKKVSLCLLIIIAFFIQNSYTQKFSKEARPVVIELVATNEHPIDLQQLKKLLGASKIHPNSLYQWQDHYVIFDKIQYAPALKAKLQKTFPTLLIKIYNDLFYKFDRKLHCSNAVMAKEWHHIVLTANLVKDVKMQKEYLAYHATQFKKWPEVAKGFCNANFQQLLVYKNGRQLMLIISIPKGESLDNLNPKTTENNPRVDQWNELMKKYQEGIPGTKPGEVWVFLKRV